MIRSELLQSLAADNPELRPEEVEQVVDIFFDEITTRLAEGGRVELRGFGTFSTRQRDARTGRNPRTGRMWMWPPSGCPISSRARKCASGSTRIAAFRQLTQKRGADRSVRAPFSVRVRRKGPGPAPERIGTGPGACLPDQKRRSTASAQVRGSAGHAGDQPSESVSIADVQVVDTCRTRSALPATRASLRQSVV